MPGSVGAATMAAASRYSITAAVVNTSRDMCYPIRTAINGLRVNKITCPTIMPSHHTDQTNLPCCRSLSLIYLRDPSLRCLCSYITQINKTRNIRLISAHEARTDTRLRVCVPSWSVEIFRNKRARVPYDTINHSVSLVPAPLIIYQSIR